MKNNKKGDSEHGAENVRDRCLNLLERHSGRNVDDTLAALNAYCGLVHKWNPFASLVSSRDAARLWLHIADSLSLAENVQRFGGASPRLFDIGSGAGFPAIPLALALPSLEVTMVERSRKKAGYLENAIVELGLLGRAAVRQGAFPEEVTLNTPGRWIVTARAIEKPEVVWRGVRKLVGEGGIFLCEWAEVPVEAQHMFHVEQIIDDWTRSGLRRGLLHIICKREVP